MKLFAYERASLLSQRASHEFCRNALGFYGQLAFHDDRFHDAMRVCRWESFVAVLADMLLVIEGELRREGTVGDRALVPGLVGICRAIMAEQELPAYRTDGWEKDIALFEARLIAAIDAPPRPAQKIAIRSAKRMFETIPIQIGIKTETKDGALTGADAADYQAVSGAVKFGMVAFLQDLRRRIRVPELRAALAAAG
ncbi:MAG: hypothetical protein NBV67_08935 [Tagaea sp.]|nr:hypothetical protein [Tagaea sp.]